ncbi:MAG: polysaccharide deacetylase family protein [Cyclobacteriaceae bacterium]
MRRNSILILLIIFWDTTFSQTPLAITIDDLPGVSQLPKWPINQRIVDSLAINNWPAIGFVNEHKFYDKEGVLENEQTEILDLWLSNGFELGNHTFSHLNYHSTKPADYFENIEMGSILTKPLAMKYASQYRYFRHPYLRNGQTKKKKQQLNNYLKNEGYQIAPVTIDNSDWLFAAAYEKAYLAEDFKMLDSISKAYVQYMVNISIHYREKAKELVGRDIPHIHLMHVNLMNSFLIATVIKELEKADFEIVPLQDVLTDPVYEWEDGYYGPAGISWIERWAIAQNKPKEFFEDFIETPQFVQDYAGRSE